jgi:hypothetical protein
MLDSDNQLQQEAIGILGVNLVYGALHLSSDPDAFIASLADNLGNERIEVDMIEFNGPSFESVDNRVLCLKLAEQGLTNAVMFNHLGHVVQPSEVLYKKACLIERGSFRPVTKVNLDMLEKAKSQFTGRDDVEDSDIETFMELTLRSLIKEGDIDYDDFIARIEVINSCGYSVLVSNYLEYFKLSAYLRRYVKKPIGLVLGLNNLADIFKEDYYANLEGGILEAFGKLFKDNVKIYAYPIEVKNFHRYREQMKLGDNFETDTDEDGLVTIDNLLVARNLRNLYKYIRENNFLENINNCNRENMNLFSRDVFKLVLERSDGWKNSLPECVCKLIEKNNLWKE